MNNVVFADNVASSGGGVHAEFFVYNDDQTGQTHDIQALTHPSIDSNHSTFLRNVADNGGAICLNGVPASFRNATMRGNVALEAGGALSLIGLSTVRVVGGVFRRNEAASGGGLMIKERSALHCFGCILSGNKASNDGGGVSITSIPLRFQSVVFQCDRCFMQRNSARLGGKDSEFKSC